MAKPLVSVIIPTHNRKNMVIRLVHSVFASTYQPIEIIVIDDASTDGTAATLKKIFSHQKNLRIIRNTSNLFTAGSRNTGAKNAKGKYLFFIDDDNVIEKHAISVLTDLFESDEKIGELGLVNYSFSDKHTLWWLCTRRNMWTSKTDMMNSLDTFSALRAWDTLDVPNAFMIRAEALAKHHISFRTMFEIMYEESDVAYRIRSAGYSVKVARDAKIYHDVGDYRYHFMRTPRRWFVFARNRIIFHSLYSTRPQLVSILLIWIWFFAAYYIYQMFRASDYKKYSFWKRLEAAMHYIWGNFAGIAYVLGKGRHETV
jgi:GT2 family glycosyltransferase